ncbi:MAG TPA: hypothetical protein VF885_16555 [Arthrobacter sp.]
MTSIDEAPRAGDGKFTFKSQTESPVALSTAAVDSQTALATRDKIREARDEAEGSGAPKERIDALDQAAAAYSARCLSDAVLAQFPDAAHLKLVENGDGENQYDIVEVWAADGTILREVTEDDQDWIDEYNAGSNGTSLQEFAYDLTLDDDSWARGNALVTNNKYNGKTAVLDVVPASAAPLPDVSGLNL